MKKIKVKDILNFGPCREWPEDRLQKYDPEDKGMTLPEICELDDVGTKDKMWLVFQPGILPDKILYRLACDFARRALLREREAGREPATESWGAIEAREKWIRGEINDAELEEKYIAAAAVAVDAAAFAATSAAVAAAGSAVAYAAAVAAASSSSAASAVAYAAAVAAVDTTNVPAAFVAAASAAHAAAAAAAYAADAVYASGVLEEREEQLKIIKKKIREKK